MPLSFVFSVESHRITRIEITHSIIQIIFSRIEQYVDVIRHKTEGINPKGIISGNFLEQTKHNEVIIVFYE